MTASILSFSWDIMTIDVVEKEKSRETVQDDDTVKQGFPLRGDVEM